jgi:hypothetical protein
MGITSPIWISLWILKTKTNAGPAKSKRWINLLSKLGRRAHDPRRVCPSHHHRTGPPVSQPWTTILIRTPTNPERHANCSPQGRVSIFLKQVPILKKSQKSYLQLRFRRRIAQPPLNQDFPQPLYGPQVLCRSPQRPRVHQPVCQSPLPHHQRILPVRQQHRTTVLVAP